MFSLVLYKAVSQPFGLLASSSKGTQKEGQDDQETLE
jgi:hypothetical protein